MDYCNGAAGLLGTSQQPMADFEQDAKKLHENRELWLHKRQPFLKRIRPTIILLQLFGLFPMAIDGHFLWDWLLKLYWLALCALHTYIAYFSVYVIKSYYGYFGMWNVFTISSTINGLKPIVNLFSFLSFGVLIRRHRKVLQELGNIDREFSKDFGLDPWLGFRNALFVGGVAVSGLGILCIRVVEFLYNKEQLGSGFLADSSLILVPMISMWNIAPLLYFFFVQNLTVYWVRKLRCIISQASFPYCDGENHCNGTAVQFPVVNSLVHRKTSARNTVDSEPDEKSDLKYYYKRFLNLTELQLAVGNFFGPWILFSFGWTLFTLCLTIYFLTKPIDFYKLPAEMSRNMSLKELEESQRILLFNIIWSVVQIILALTHIFLICSLGTSTNEQTRLVMRPVLRVVSEDVSPEDRFTVSCFVYKMSTQYYWGSTVWKAFPIERSVFFTIGSLIITYAVLLLRINSDGIAALKALNCTVTC